MVALSADAGGDLKSDLTLGGRTPARVLLSPADGGRGWDLSGVANAEVTASSLQTRTSGQTRT